MQKVHVNKVFHFFHSQVTYVRGGQQPFLGWQPPYGKAVMECFLPVNILQHSWYTREHKTRQKIAASAWFPTRTIDNQDQNYENQDSFPSSVLRAYLHLPIYLGCSASYWKCAWKLEPMGKSENIFRWLEYELATQTYSVIFKSTYLLNALKKPGFLVM